MAAENVTPTDPYEQARDAVLRDAESWMPHREPDQPATIVGLYVRSENTPENGFGVSEMKTLRERDGREWSVRLYGKVLAREWKAADPQIGEVVAIRYLGEAETKDKTPYRAYKVAVARQPRPTEPETATPEQDDAFERAQLRMDDEAAAERKGGESAETVAVSSASHFGDDAPF